MRTILAAFSGSAFLVIGLAWVYIERAQALGLIR